MQWQATQLGAEALAPAIERRVALFQRVALEAARITSIVWAKGRGGRVQRALLAIASVVSMKALPESSP